MAKNLRSDLARCSATCPRRSSSPGATPPATIGTEITSPGETQREDLADCRARLQAPHEALRTIEEYSKVVAPRRPSRSSGCANNAYTLEQRLEQRIQVGRRFMAVRLYVLLWSKMCHGSLRETARAAIAGGADANPAPREGRARRPVPGEACELRELTDETGRIFIVNDRPDIAAIVGADGVHLGQNDLPIAEARRLLRPGALIGKSTHNVQQIRTAVNEGADYISIGPMFFTTTKDAGPIAGVKLLKQAIKETSLPIVPIGGIHEGNVGKLLAAGAERVSVCSVICKDRNPKAVTEALKRKIVAAGAKGGRKKSAAGE